MVRLLLAVSRGEGRNPWARLILRRRSGPTVRSSLATTASVLSAAARSSTMTKATGAGIVRTKMLINQKKEREHHEKNKSNRNHHRSNAVFVH